jgi:uncharacterized protein YcbX
MHLSEIWIYPVKSLGGIRLTQCEAFDKGLQYDRRWMVVDQHGVFLTQRTNIKMAMIDVTIGEKGLLLFNRLERANQILVPFISTSAQRMNVRVWNDEVIAHTVCDQADLWLTIQLGKPVRIVQMQDDTKRMMGPEFVKDGLQVSFADDFPYLLISESSLTDLNNRLDRPVEMKRFRPNFVVSDTEAFAEDHWEYIQIGDLTFHVAKSCERCVITTIDTYDGTRGPEPLKTLAKYRKINNKVHFGQNLIGLNAGMIYEGDPVRVLG